MFARFIIACLLRFLYVVSGIMQQTIWCLTGQVWNIMIYLIVVVPMDSIKYTTSHPFASYLLSTTINYDYFSTFAIIFARIKKTYHSYSNSFTIFWAINIFCFSRLAVELETLYFPCSLHIQMCLFMHVISHHVLLTWLRFDYLVFHFWIIGESLWQTVFENFVHIVYCTWIRWT